MAPAWHHGDILEAIEATVPGDRPALVHGDRLVDWRAFARRTYPLIRDFALAEAGLASGAPPGPAASVPAAQHAQPAA